MLDQASGGSPEQSDQLAAALADAEPSLRRLAHRLCGSTADAHDLVQDTFERAMHRGIPPEVRSPRAWLATIMHRLFIDRCRAAARHPIPKRSVDASGDIVGLEPDLEEPAWTQITLNDVREALQHVQQVYRDVYSMHSFEHLSHEQIAQRLSIPRLTVATRLHRARRRLREVLTKRFGMEAAL
jgi:RNA polymerase sigma-70 factor (ECF subfamily)